MDVKAATRSHIETHKPQPPAKARLAVATFGCEQMAELEPQALGVTYWFDPDADGEPQDVSIRFTGRRIGAKGKPGPRDRFEVVETVEGVVPGSGPVAVTTRIRSIPAGSWHITAGVAPQQRRGARGGRSGSQAKGSASISGSTVFDPLVGVIAPGARLGAWSALVAVGAAVALVAQWVLAQQMGLRPVPTLLLSLLACLVGLAGAKLYYVIGHLVKGDLAGGLRLLTGGMCIQGFVIGAVLTLAAGAPAVNLPVGALLDATAPGLLFGMTVGRFGCLLGGCCAGRPTASRWGVWSSDRRLGMRRIPVQVMESGLALAVALAALSVLLTAAPQPAGVVFVAAVAAYTLGRQLLFTLRAGPRHTSHGRTATAILSAVVLAAAVFVAISAG